jgi:hypothetical protein
MAESRCGAVVVSRSLTNGLVQVVLGRVRAPARCWDLGSRRDGVGLRQGAFSWTRVDCTKAGLEGRARRPPGTERGGRPAGLRGSFGEGEWWRSVGGQLPDCVGTVRGYRYRRSQRIGGNLLIVSWSWRALPGRRRCVEAASIRRTVGHPCCPGAVNVFLHSMSAGTRLRNEFSERELLTESCERTRVGSLSRSRCVHVSAAVAFSGGPLLIARNERPSHDAYRSSPLPTASSTLAYGLLAHVVRVAVSGASAGL